MNDARAAEYGGGGEDASAPSGRAFSVDEKDRDKLVAPACKAMEPLATESVGFDTSGAAERREKDAVDMRGLRDPTLDAGPEPSCMLAK